ncbi:MAG TPA: hypothetical protein VFE78_34030 [Gemmataceae bacterium]|jgi:Flp pilus assembly pilin Flp|nr:hypothetical protein [Gemmataceae bacterium]
MRSVSRACARFLADEAAHSSVEYASILAMVVLTIEVSVASLGSFVTNPFWTTSNALAAQNVQLGNRYNQGNNGQGSGGTVQVSGS